MKYLSYKEIRNMNKAELIQHLQTIAQMLSSEHGVDEVELDSCQDYDDGTHIYYQNEHIGIDAVTPQGLRFNDPDSGEVIRTLPFEEAHYFETDLLAQIVNNYQGTIVNEVL